MLMFTGKPLFITLKAITPTFETQDVSINIFNILFFERAPEQSNSTFITLVGGVKIKVYIEMSKLETLLNNQEMKF